MTPVEAIRTAIINVAEALSPSGQCLFHLTLMTTLPFARPVAR
jgi:hypothetical protein